MSANHELPKEYLKFAGVLMKNLHREVYFKKRDEGLSVQHMRDVDYPDVDDFEEMYQAHLKAK